MNRSHRLLARSLAAFLILIQALSGGAVAVAHAGQVPEMAVNVVTPAPSDDTTIHGDMMCPFCVLASSQAEHTPVAFITTIAAIPSRPDFRTNDGPAVERSVTLAVSPRAPPAIHS